MANEPLLEDLARAVLDGSPVDWAQAQSLADANTTPVVRVFKTLAAVAQVHRTPHAADLTNTKPSAHELHPPTDWGHLRILERIGRGAFGEVYRAWDERLDREVALKLMPADPQPAGADGSSFIREGRLLARVHHPNVVTIHGAEQIGGRIGLWMEFVRGRTLEDLLESGTSFTATEVMHVGVELSRAVHAVHGAGLLHRDIKAHNVMRADDGRVVLMDFGTGRELNDGGSDLTGTPLYLAPEVFAGRPATVQSDLYSLGVLLFRLATGKYPVSGKSIGDLRHAHERGERITASEAHPKIPPRLGRLIDQMVDPQPERRPQSTEAIGARLLKIQRDDRLRPVVQAVGILGTLLIAGAITWAWRSTSAQHTPSVETAQGRDGTSTAVDPARSTAPPSQNNPGAGATEPAIATTPLPPVAAAIGRRRSGIRPSIQVLPFTNDTGRETDNWLSLALAEMLLREFRGSEAFRWIPGAAPLAAAQLGATVARQSRVFARPTVPADIVVSGHFSATGSPRETAGLRLSVKLEDTTGNGAAVTLNDTGTTADLRGLMARLGRQARAALGVTALSREQANAITASQPANADAARAYAEGLAKNPRDAVELMHQAIGADPRFAPAYAVLIEAFGAATDRDKRDAAAARATELSADFPREERMLIELRSLSPPDVVRTESLFQELFHRFPDTLLYGFRTALAQARRLEFHEGLATVGALGSLPGASDHVDLMQLESRLARSLGDYPRARRALEKAAKIATDLDDQVLFTDILYQRAFLAEEMGDLPTALRFSEDAVKRFGPANNLRFHGGRLTIARILRGLGDAAGAAAMVGRLPATANDQGRFPTTRDALMYVGDLLAAEGYLSESRLVWDRVIAESPEAESVRSWPLPLLGLGSLLHRQGHLSESQPRLEQALSNVLQRNIADGEARVRTSMARLFLDRGEIGAARDNATRSVELPSSREMSVNAHALSTLAHTLLAAGETAAARRAIDDASRIQVTSQPFQFVNTHRAIVQARVAIEEGKLREGRAHAERAVVYAHNGRIAFTDPRPDDVAAADSTLALAALADGDLSVASRAVARAAPRLEVTQDRLLRLSGGIAAARVGAASGGAARIARARRELDAIVREAADIGAVAIAFDARLALGEIEIKAGDFSSGRTRLAVLQREALGRGFHSIARKAGVTAR